MGEIYNFSDFKKKREEMAGVKPEDNENEKKEKSILKDRVDVIKLTELISLVANLMSSTAGNPRREAYQAQYKLVNTYSDAEIVGWINNFNRMQVAAKTLFFAALLDVAKDRKLIFTHF